MPRRNAKDTLDAQAALDAALEKAKGTRKPRKPRMKKVEAAPEPQQDVAPEHPAGPAPEAPGPEAAPPAEPPTELPTAKPRKSGRRAWEINLRGDHHTWERVESPATDEFPSEVIFRFKHDASEAQRDLLDRHGFQYDAERKEGWRVNDAEGREAADKVSWYLKVMQRGQGAALSA